MTPSDGTRETIYADPNLLDLSTKVEGREAPRIIDLGSGGALVVDRMKSPATDGIAAYTPEPTSETFVVITSTSTTYVASASIDLTDYDRITFIPNITTAAGTNCYLKIEWSFDGTTWFDEFESGGTTWTNAAPAAGERLRDAVLIMVIEVPSASTGYKSLANFTMQKRARYCRISQKSDAAVTVASEIHYQLL